MRIGYVEGMWEERSGSLLEERMVVVVMVVKCEAG
jgi:hypothetical protein